MERIIAVINQKGGVGKTTTVMNVGAGLHMAGKRVLMIDLDSQGSLTMACGIVADGNASTYEFMTSGANEAIKTLQNGCDLLPADDRLATINMNSSARLLQQSLTDIEKNYDYILIDCAPTLGMLTLNALTACNEVFVPMQAEYMSLLGMADLMNTIEVVQKRLNPDCKLSAVIINQYDKRKKLHATVIDKIHEKYPDALMQSKIRNNVAVAEAPMMGKDIFEYDKNSNGAKDYEALVKEIIERE